jgi:hypothetical protein
MIFNTIEELLSQAEKDGACSEGLVWAKRQTSLEYMFVIIPFNYRYWCLAKGYEQFFEGCDKHFLTGNLWSYILEEQPQFHVKCDWGLFSGWNWSRLLLKQPQFHVHCFWEKLDGYDWTILLKDHPQFHDKCDWSLLDCWNWSFLLRHQPQLESFRSLS